MAGRGRGAGVLAAIDRASGTLGLLLLAAILLLVNVLAARHYRRADWTATRIYSLSDKTRALVGALRRPVRATLLMVPPGDGRDSVYFETREILRRLAALSPQLSLEEIDVDADPSRTLLLAKRYRVEARELREGVVAVSSGARSKVVPSAMMAVYQGGRLAAFRGEAVLLAAIRAVTASERSTVCFTRGHGEASITSYEDGGYGRIADEVKRDDHRVRALDGEALATGARDCTAVVVGGPRRAFAPVEVDGLDRYLRQGGRVLLLLGPVLDRGVTRHRGVGLAGWLRRWGIDARRNVVLDRNPVPGEQPLLSWATRDGYGDHPLTRGFGGRMTVWRLAREVRPLEGSTASVLVRTSAEGWGETDLASLRGERPLRYDPGVDTPGPVPVAVAVARGGARLVVFGSERGVLNRRLASDLRDYNRDLLLAAIGWLTGASHGLAIGPRPAEHVRLRLDDRQLTKVFLIAAVALPLLALCGGVIVWWRRRA